MKRKAPTIFAIAAVLVLGGGGIAQRVVAQQKVALNDMAAESGQWAMPSQNYANLRYSDLEEIKSDNVANLKAAWTMSSGATRGHEGQPIVIGDTMHYQSAHPNNVVSRTNWIVATESCCSRRNSTATAARKRAST